jgi:hypothetical protein
MHRWFIARRERMSNCWNQIKVGGQPKNEHGENASESNQGQVVDFRDKFTDFIRRRMVAGFEIRNALRFQMLDLSI